MAYRLIWSRMALDDVKAIAEFIERDSPRYAKAVVRRIMQSVEHLQTFPTASAIVPEFDRPDLRQLIVHSYRIVVRLKEDAVEVVAVIHGARDFRSALGRRGER